ncbi:MAG: Flp pilus assembly complex ATPase component TadA [Elusimicrobia bacterium]|nr:Flp pilus assembly complex ATPase component TadA [Elusimicrobiota bacterium]
MAKVERQRLGDILVMSGLITQDQLNRALKVQAQLNCMLGEAVVKLGFANEEAIALGIARQLGIPYASRENKVLRVDKTQKLDGIINERFARDNMILPLFIDERVLTVAMADPDNVLVIENLQLMTGYDISPAISTRAQILKAIDEFYTQGGTNLIDTVMQKQDTPDGGVAEIEEVDTSDARLDLDKTVSEAKGAQVVSLVNAILKQAIAERASDIHLESYDERILLRFRIDGVLYERPQPPKESIGAMVSRIKILSKLDIAERRLPQDGAFSMKLQNRVIDMRVSMCPTVYGEKVVMRILDKGAVTLKVDNLGFEGRQRSDFLTAAEMPHGLIFLTGPTGSGKTTTLYAVLNTIKSNEKNYMTIEDPVELKLEGINQVQVKSQIGLTFASALRSFLRQDPDVILVGEVRDQETARTCLQAALTGHLVLSTLHTNAALDAVVRLIDLGIEPFLLSSSLGLTAAQRLVRVLCESCKRPVKPDSKMLDVCLKESMLTELPNPANVTFFEPGGCDKCAKTGYIGRRGIYEVYLITPEMREVIYRKGGDLTQLKEIGSKSGMINLRACGWRKVLAGKTTPEEIMSVTLAE